MRARCQQGFKSFERTQQTFLLRKRPYSCKEFNTAIHHVSSATFATFASDAKPHTLAKTSEARFNEIGVQHVSSHIHSQIFPGSLRNDTGPDAELVELSKQHLQRHDLLGKITDKSAPIAFDLPDLQGGSLDEHFYRLGLDSAEPYLELAKAFSAVDPPKKPKTWSRKSGWTKYYENGRQEQIDAPDAQALTFDTEVMWRETNYPAMACAVSADNWYSWLSPWLLGESSDDKHLIPLGDPGRSRIIVGHNIGYDRARVAEEYSLKQSRNFFIDTMSLHVAVNGMCSRQRPTWVRHRKAREVQDEITESYQAADLSALLDAGSDFEQEEEAWVGRSSVNSLRDVAKFHCGITIDKTRRDDFGELDRGGIIARVDELLTYCATDVEVTHRVYKKVFPLFLNMCPHPVSFAALRHLSAEILPVNRTWDKYIESAEATYQKLSSDVEARLVALAEKALTHQHNASEYENDHWLRQLDWSGQEIRMVKGKGKGDPLRPAARQKKPGMPKWYKDLFLNNDAAMSLTVRTRVAPLLLRLAWDGNALFWSDKHGWTFIVPQQRAHIYREQGMTECDIQNDGVLPDHRNDGHTLFKVPHKDGPTARCASPLSKGYLQFFENGTLTSEYSYAREALEMNASCSYWISARDRITSQMVVYERTSATSGVKGDVGYILPQIIPMGTITRRAVENTWLTAANAKANRVGSELKSMIKAPPGYAFVGADVDSQELWIASLVGDASFKLHGGNAIGFMTLEGTKAAGTDLHSRTAKILGISRNDAKVFNYGRIYGAGLKFAQSLLRRFNPSISDADAKKVAEELYLETKGKKERRKAIRERGFWRGGTESLVFNRLEDFAEQEKPRTPVLGAGITEALMREYISKGGFMTSRINWAIQSSGVDYLHLLIVSMDYLCRRFDIEARLALTVHDEIRYLTKSHDRYRTAMALQVANVWTRAMFSQQMGIHDLPQSCAYFSAVDIDHVLRKEVDMECVTPSHPEKISPGESLDILALLEKGEEAFLDQSIVPTAPPEPMRFEFQYQSPVMESLQSEHGRDYIRAQIAADTAELNKVVKQMKPVPVKKSAGKILRLSESEHSQNTGEWSNGLRRIPMRRSDLSKALSPSNASQREAGRRASIWPPAEAALGVLHDRPSSSRAISVR